MIRPIGTHGDGQLATRRPPHSTVARRRRIAYAVRGLLLSAAIVALYVLVVTRGRVPTHLPSVPL